MKKWQQIGPKIRWFSCLLAIAIAFAPAASASATLLLEEPYGKLGFFTATGHAAVYLSGICADSPLVVRSCKPGETGVVISRYDGVGGYDWIAIPLVPYFYAVEKSEDVPLFADPKIVSVLRDRYRRKYLETVAPDLADGSAPAGNWYELVGSSYDRTIYGFEIETSAKQDDDLIRKLNSSANQSHFRTVSRNCADFVKDIINFYYPKALRRSIVSDVGITTPKQMARGLVRYSAHHPELAFDRLIIPQLPGSEARSANVHGVVESFFKSKKYIVPSAVVSPIFAGCVAAVYVGGGSGRFDPARNALVLDPGNQPGALLGREDRVAYEKELNHLLAESAASTTGTRVKKSWERLEAKAYIDFDDQGHPVLQMDYQEQKVSLGLSAANVLSSSAPPQLAQELLEARLLSELHEKKPHGVSEAEVSRDWTLLRQALSHSDVDLASRNSKHQSLEAAAISRSATMDSGHTAGSSGNQP